MIVAGVKLLIIDGLTAAPALAAAALADTAFAPAVPAVADAANAPPAAVVNPRVRASKPGSHLVLFIGTFLLTE
ncbi:hypothetical protein D3C75_977570 [compost metagenome]